ncbi:hypothetical protein BV900_27395 [Agrobacterium tumefaciens]|nr:hypothetical protein BV900_27395 [Agrobacterium tumefaciens]
MCDFGNLPSIVERRLIMALDVSYLKKFVAELDEVMTRPFKKPDFSKKSGNKNENVRSSRAATRGNPQMNPTSETKTS